MIRAAHLVTFLLCIQAISAQGADLVLHFEGVINGVVDANDGNLPIDFDPVPVGSLFSGTIAYDTDSPPTYGGTGYTQFLDLLSSGGSLTVNGHTFTTVSTVSATVISQEAGFGFSGVNLGNQPLSLPAGWSVDHSESPYFTLQLRDAPTQARPLTLPSSQAEFPTDNMYLVLDFQQPVTVDEAKYGDRVYIRGEVTSLQVVDPTPPPRELDIDVLPSSSQNKINLSDRKPKPLEVAVFGETDFDVRAIVPETIGLGDPILTNPNSGDGQKVSPISMRYVDLDRDRRPDLLVRFDLLEMKRAGAIDEGTESLEFEGLLDTQGVVFGSDAVSIQGVKHKHK